jgi:5-methylcytosine-specific restriction endonuclease McrA
MVADSFEGDVLNAPVLVLNRGYLPVRVTTVRHAFMMLFMGRARALDAAYEPLDFAAWMASCPCDGDELLGTTSGPVRVPRVLLLSEYNRVPRAPLRLSRRNIFLRDDYTCQYCRSRLPARDLNLDHVLPRCRGGRSTWENLVTSCRVCNLRKGRATPEECGMALRRVPSRPSWTVVAQLARTRTRYEQWAPFLGGAVIAGPPDE